MDERIRERARKFAEENFISEWTDRDAAAFASAERDAATKQACEVVLKFDHASGTFQEAKWILKHIVAAIRSRVAAQGES